MCIIIIIIYEKRYKVTLSHQKRRFRGTVLCMPANIFYYSDVEYSRRPTLYSAVRYRLLTLAAGRLRGWN